MPPANPLRFRQVHLDFHTSPLIPDVGRDFDADAFARTVEEAHIDSITCFAKCHHGMCYYPTTVGPKHPSLPFDLLGSQIESCHRRNIRVPIYLTSVWDSYMAELHPEWQQRKLDGSLIGAKPGEAGWKWVCLNSPYLDYQEQQTKELLDLYECDGFFYDIVFQANELSGREDSGCCCEYCLASMRKLNLNPESTDDQRKHSQIIIEKYMSRLSGLIRGRKPNATIFYNSRVRQGMGRENQWVTHVEIEALPTGGWGYAYYPFWVRYARKLKADLAADHGEQIQNPSTRMAVLPKSKIQNQLPTMGMTGRFHRSWADFGGLKSAAALKFECGAMLANGSVCSIGDQLHPRGALDPAVYEAIGEAFSKVEQLEQWCKDASPVTEIALLLVEQSNQKAVRNDSDEGAAKMLLELHHQFDILEADADWSDYRVLAIADRGKPTPELTDRLRLYLRSGGKLLLSHEALLDPDTGRFALDEEMGVSYIGPLEYNPSFFRLRPNFRHGVRDFHWAMLGAGSVVAPTLETDVMADVFATYFNRAPEHFTSHYYSPRTDVTGAPAVTWHKNIAYIYSEIFKSYQMEGDSIYRRLVGNALDLLLPIRLLQTDAPPSTEATLVKQENRTVVHLVNYQPNRRGSHVEVIEQVVPLTDIQVGLRTNKPPSSAYMAPDGRPLEVRYAEGVAWVTAPRVEEHGMVVFEA